MKINFLSLLTTVMLAISIIPYVFANESGTGIGIDITPSEFPVHIWQCEQHILLDDNVQAGHHLGWGRRQSRTRSRPVPAGEDGQARRAHRLGREEEVNYVRQRINKDFAGYSFRIPHFGV